MAAGSLALASCLAGLAVTASAADAAPSAAVTTGWVRFGHFAPSAGPVTILLDGTAVATNATFQAVSPYLSTLVGHHTVTVRPNGSTTSVLSGAFDTTPGSATTMAIVRRDGSLSLQGYRDDLSAPPAGDAKIRVISTAPAVPDVSVTLDELTPVNKVSVAASPGSLPSPVVFSDVAYATASPYLAVPAGQYHVQVQNGGSPNPVISGNNWPVQANTVASIVVIEGPAAPTLEVLRDAVGTPSMPAGGMATGEGGTARPAPVSSSGLVATLWASGLGLVAMLALARRLGTRH